MNKPGSSSEDSGMMEAADLSDIRKIRLIQAGQAEHYEPLVRKYTRRAHSIALGMVQNAEDAVEIAQDAFLKTFRAITRFDTSQRFFPWFYRILRNTCLSHLRRKKHVSTTTMNREDEQGRVVAFEDESSKTPEEIMVNDELRARFMSALNALPEKDREILCLRHFGELEYQEIADRLEIPIGTVMSRLFHARRRLREKLEPLL